MSFEVFQTHTIPYQEVESSSDIHWESIDSIEINQFPWYEAGTQQATQVKIAYSESHLYLQARCEDSWSYACHTELNSAVCEDSCFEFFVSPRQERDTDYFNMEVNCVGTLHYAYGPGRENRQLSTPKQASSIKINSSLAGPLKSELDSDNEWLVSLEIPLKALNDWAKDEINFTGIWWANFYRCGGRKEPQYAVWNAIQSEQPDYHRPEQFGQLVFGPRP